MTTIPPEMLIETAADSPAGKLAVVINECNLSTTAAERLKAALLPIWGEALCLMQEADALVVTDPTQCEMMDRAKEKRLAIRKRRVEIEHVCDDEKDNAIKIQKGINGIKKFTSDQMKAVEARLENSEKFAERIEAQRKLDLKIAREAILKPYGFEFFGDVAEMTQPQFDHLHQQFASLKKSNEEAAAKAEADRVAAETARLAEESKIREENIRLQKEAEAREAAHKAELAKQEAQRREIESKAAAERAETQRKADAERKAAELKLQQERREAAERERVAEDGRRKERAMAAVKADEERKAREAAEKALADKEAAEEKKRKAEAAAKKKAEAAPDRIKMQAFAATLRGIKTPAVKDGEFSAMLEAASSEIMELAQRIEDAAKE